MTPFSLLIFLIPSSLSSSLPLVITTWSADGFQKATLSAFTSIPSGRLFALVEGLSTCERLQCDTTVGYGGSPDENGETTLDALLIDGPGHRMGAVASMHRVKDAARVAWAVMNYTRHTMIVGEEATRFAVEMGFKSESLETKQSKEMTEIWKKNKCQPNFRQNVVPDSQTSCGPYSPLEEWKEKDEGWNNRIDRFNHDTIGMVVIDEEGEVSAGTSTNGASHKIPGRVGDSPMPGSGAYLARGIGGAAATGDGDIMMRFLPSYQTVEFMRSGDDPSIAANKSMKRIVDEHPHFSGAIVAADVSGRMGASCAGLKTFSYSTMKKGDSQVVVQTVDCIN